MPCCVLNADAAGSVFAGSAGFASSAGSASSAALLYSLLICGSAVCLVLFLSAVLLLCRFTA